MRSRFVSRERKEIGRSRELRGPRESDRWIWWCYALELHINRHAADSFNDGRISNALRKVRERIPLDYEV